MLKSELVRLVVALSFSVVRVWNTRDPILHKATNETLDQPHFSLSFLGRMIRSRSILKCSRGPFLLLIIQDKLFMDRFYDFMHLLLYAECYLLCGQLLNFVVGRFGWVTDALFYYG